MPAVDPNNAIKNAAYDLLNALENKNKNSMLDITPSHRHEIEMLAKKCNMTITPPRVKDNMPPQRVREVKPPTESVDTTSPCHVKSQKKIHQKFTRRNTPIPQKQEFLKKQSQHLKLYDGQTTLTQHTYKEVTTRYISHKRRYIIT